MRNRDNIVLSTLRLSPKGGKVWYKSNVKIRKSKR